MTRGIHTLDDLRARCGEDPDSGCWHWLGHVCDRGIRMLVTPAGGKPEVCFGRRAGLLLAGASLAGKVVRPRAICRSDDCVAPHHSIAETRAVYTKWHKARGAFVPDGRALAAIAESAKARRKLTDAQAEEVRRSQRSTDELARFYGVARATINGIQARRIYKPLPASSVWAWRPDEREAA